MSNISSSCLFDDASKCNIIVGVKRTAAFLSLIGCIFMIFIIWLFRKTQSFTQRLILYLSIAALANSIAYMVGGIHEDGSACNFEAFLLTWFEWSVLLWVCTITSNLFRLASHISTEYSSATLSAEPAPVSGKYEVLYHGVCWLLPAGIACLPFSGDRYGPAGAWCWIRNEYPAWRFGIWYGPLFFIITLMFLANIYIILTVRRKTKTWEGMYNPDIERQKQIHKEEIKPLMYYPLVYLCISLLPLVNRIQNAISHEPEYTLTVLHAFFSPLAGALNALVFGLDRDTRHRLTVFEIKSAWQKRFAARAVIHEYPSSSSGGGGGGAEVGSVDESVEQGTAATDTVTGSGYNALA